MDIFDLPLPCLSAVLANLWEDPADLICLSLACKEFEKLVFDPLLWKKCVHRRFGKDVCPGVKPTPEDAQPQQLQGWVFYQGRDGAREGDKEAPEAAGNPQQLEDLARRAGAEAFTTSGKLIKELLPQDAWRHSSFHPTQGMYVHHLATQYKAIEPPPPQDQQQEQQWPPEVPGWQFFPSSVSPGFNLAEPPQSLSRFRSLEQLLQAMLEAPEVAAVTTEGEVKSQLRPQACWQTHPAYDMGIFVKQQLAEQQGLVPHAPVPDFRQLYSQLHKLRCDAGQMDAVWLNDGYLQLKPEPDSPADSGLALLLNDVCWLDVAATIPGVPPGTYTVSWVMDVTRGASRLYNSINLTAEATPHGGSHPPRSAGSVQTQVAAATFQQLAEQTRRDGSVWSRVPGGQLTVTEFSTVRLKFWAHDGSWKHGFRWAFVELLPVAASAAASDSRRRSELLGGAAARGAGSGGGSGAGSSLAGQLDQLAYHVGQQLQRCLHGMAAVAVAAVSGGRAAAAHPVGEGDSSSSADGESDGDEEDEDEEGQH